MNKKIIDAAVSRLLANAYAGTDAGAKAHRQDVVLLQSAIKHAPDETRRWRWLREHISLTALHNLLAERFKAVDRAYAAEVDDAVDAAEKFERLHGWAVDHTAVGFSPARARKKHREELEQLEAQSILGLDRWGS